MRALWEREMSMPVRSLLAVALAALLLTSLAFATARSGAASSPLPATQAPPPAESGKSRRAGEAEPKIVRWVCTDHLCGGCDGNCSRSGHVAVSRRGHCACTPTAGSKLDKAIRKAFLPHLKGR